MTPSEIKAARDALGLTQRQAAGMLTSLGYPTSGRTWEAWEGGRAPSRLGAAGLAVFAARAKRSAAHKRRT